MAKVKLVVRTFYSGLPQGPGLGSHFARALIILSFVILAWLLATLPLMVAGVIVSGVVVAILLLRWPWLVWVGLAIVLPFTSAIRLGPLSITDLMLVAAISLWFINGVRRDSLRLEKLFLPLIIAFYVAALLIATSAAVNLSEAMREVIKWVEVLVTVWLVGGALTGDQKRWLVIGLLLGGALQGILGLYQFLFQIGPPHFVLFDRFMRAAGTFDQPNPYAGYLGLTLPVAVSLAIWGWQRFIALGEQKFSRSQALQWALIASTAAALIGMGLLASWSRGGWLGAVVGVAFVVIFRSRHAMILSAVGGLLAIIALMMGMGNPNLLPAAIVRRLADLPAYFGVGLMEVVEQPVTDENFAVIERLAHWIAALRMLEISPWIGVGPGNYATVYPEVMLPRWQDPLGHAHNIYLNVLAESGLLGLATYLFLWIGAFAWIWQRQRSVPAGSWESALQIGVLGVLLHLSVHNFFDNLFVRGIYLHIAFWLAVVCVVEPGGTDKVDQTTGVKI